VVGINRGFDVGRQLETTVISYPIQGSFKISRGAKTSADVIVAMISEGGVAGRGECVPYRRYGETLDSVTADIEAMRAAIESGLGRQELQVLFPPGAARNAVDCALWDLDAKTGGTPVARSLGIARPAPLTTAYTISLDTPEVMAAQAARHAHRALLKIKTGTSDDEARLRAVRAAAPEAGLILDANEGWDEDNIVHHLSVAADCGVALIEQPLPAERDAILAGIERRVPICADESAHVAGDLAALVGRYDAVNIKLDKAGGLTAALAMRQEAERLGLRIMVGCMVGSSLAMAPAVLLAQGVDFVDLDGPLLLAADCTPSLTYEASLVYPPERALWG
jgi:L-alanine-DL-glutamate epimerase-like enolase superfamily enzyme